MADAVPGTAVLRFARHAGAIAAADLRKLARDPTELFTRAIQPLLWFLVFGQVFSRARVIPTGSLQLYTLPAKARYDAGTPFTQP